MKTILDYLKLKMISLKIVKGKVSYTHINKIFSDNESKLKSKIAAMIASKKFSSHVDTKGFLPGELLYREFKSLCALSNNFKKNSSNRALEKEYLTQRDLFMTLLKSLAGIRWGSLVNAKKYIYFNTFNAGHLLYFLMDSYRTSFGHVTNIIEILFFTSDGLRTELEDADGSFNGLSDPILRESGWVNPLSSDSQCDSEHLNRERQLIITKKKILKNLTRSHV